MAWGYWCDSGTSSSTTSSTWDSWNYGGTADTSASGTWSSWASNTITSVEAGGTTNEVWITWTTDNTSVVSPEYTVYTSEPKNNVVYFKQPKETVEKKRALKAQMEINKIWAKIRMKEVEEERKTAIRRAKLLLVDVLGTKQFRQYQKTGRVFIKGKKFDWLITKQGRVSKIEKNKVIDLCVHLRDSYSYVEEDKILALLLAAKMDDSKLAKTGNFIRSRGKYNRREIDSFIREAANY